MGCVTNLLWSCQSAIWRVYKGAVDVEYDRFEKGLKDPQDVVNRYDSASGLQKFFRINCPSSIERHAAGEYIENQKRLEEKSQRDSS